MHIMPLGLTMLSTKAINYLTKIQNLEWENSLWVVDQDSLNDSQNYIYCWYCPGLLPDVEVTLILLKILHTLDLGPGRLEVDVTWNPTSLAFIVSEGAKQIAKGGELAIVISSCDACVKHKNEKHGKIPLKLQWWHLYIGSKQQLSNWTEGLLYRSLVF